MSVEVCNKCKGSGYIPIRKRSIKDGKTVFINTGKEKRCDNCGGKGYFFDDDLMI